jgi:glyoxylase I family protein
MEVGLHRPFAGDPVTASTTNYPDLSHVEFPTPDIDETQRFYEDVLGFQVVVDTTGRIEEGGTLRHLFFRCGDGQLIAFMEARGIDGLTSPGDVAQAAGVPDPLLHVAFQAESVGDLEDRRATLADEGQEPSPVIDFGWCQSFYFKDPHGLMLEFCCVIKPLPEQGSPETFELEMSRAELENFAGLG